MSLAQREGLDELRNRCRRTRAAALPDEVERRNAIHRSRYLRHWRGPDGAFGLHARLTPDAGAVVMGALGPHIEAAFATARQEGRTEPYGAHGADALVALATQGPKGGGDSDTSPAPSATIQVRVDWEAFRRGYTQADETCEVAGVGPVPVATVRALSSDAIISAVVTKGVDITTVAHLGRTIPAHLRTALAARDPHCVVPGCQMRERLQIDHIVDFATGGPTCLSNLARLCARHHDQKTYQGYRLQGGPGQWRWEPPSSVGPSPPPAHAPP